MGSLFASDDVETSSTQTTAIPTYLKEGSKDAINRATALADKPYTEYTGDLVAGLDPNQAAAIQGAADNAGQWQENLNQNQYMLGQAADASMSGLTAPAYADAYSAAGPVQGSVWDQAAADQYMSPYLASSLDPAIRQMREQASVSLLGGRGRAASQGALGGVRQDFVDMETERGMNQNIGDMLAQGYQNAYMNAQNIFTSDAQREQNRQFQNLSNLFGEQQFNVGQRGRELDRYNQAGQGLSQLASMRSDLANQDLSNLMATGTLGQAQEQSQLSSNYQQYLEERDWGERGLNTLLTALGSVPHGSTTTGTETTPGGSPFSQLLGLGLSAAGAMRG